MKAMFASLLALPLLFSQAYASPRVDKVVNQLNTVLQCPQHVWPGLKKDFYRVVFAQPSTKESWLWIGSTGKTESISAAELPLSSDMPKYSFSQFRGEKAVIINLD